MKEKLIELLKQCEKECDEKPCDECIYDTSLDCVNQHIADFLIANGVKITRAEDLKCTTSRDYEAEYHELIHKHSELYADHQAMEVEFARMRAQLDIVYLIFGGK